MLEKVASQIVGTGKNGDVFVVHARGCTMDITETKFPQRNFEKKILLRILASFENF